MKTREQNRNERAEAVCRELRYQMANRAYNEDRLWRLIIAWMKVAKKSRYERPVINNQTPIRRGLQNAGQQLRE